VWDRQQWLLPDGFASAPNIVEGNFIIGNSNGPKLVDLDDGSRDHIVHNNVLAYGYVKFKGGNHSADQNVVVAYVPSQVGCCMILQTHNKHANYKWSNNTCFAPQLRGKINKVPYDWNGVVGYCTKDMFFTSHNHFFGTGNAFDGVCGTLNTWRFQLGQDAQSIFGKQNWLASDIIDICRSTIFQSFGK
jgi:hypothetical protein